MELRHFKKLEDQELQELWSGPDGAVPEIVVPALTEAAAITGPAQLRRELQNLEPAPRGILSRVRWAGTLLIPTCAAAIVLALLSPGSVLQNIEPLQDEDLIAAFSEAQIDSSDVALLEVLDEDFLTLEETI